MAATEGRGVIARTKGGPVSVETVLVPAPIEGEAARPRPGLRRLPHRPALPGGGINDDFPFLLGHEAAGIVEAVGPDVTLGRRRATS